MLVLDGILPPFTMVNSSWETPILGIMCSILEHQETRLCHHSGPKIFMVLIRSGHGLLPMINGVYSLRNLLWKMKAGIQYRFMPGEIYMIGLMITGVT